MIVETWLLSRLKVSVALLLDVSDLQVVLTSVN